MFDVAAMGAALTSLKTIVDLAGRLKDAQLAMKISSEVVEIQGKLLVVQQQALTLQDENRSLKEEIRALKDSSSLQARVGFHDGAVWEKQEDGSEAGPFCPSCWTELKLRRGQIMSVGRGFVEFACAEHKQTYLFHVPDRLVKGMDLTIHRVDEVDYSSGFESGPGSWMS